MVCLIIIVYFIIHLHNYIYLIGYLDNLQLKLYL